MWDKGEHVQTIVRAIRLHPALRPDLWGNNAQYRPFVLSEDAEAELEDACESIDGFTVLVLAPGRQQEFVSAIVKAMKIASSAPLTVRRPELRPLVRRLIESVLPDVPLLAEAELDDAVRAIAPQKIRISTAREDKEVTR